jgi:hypothetical protein
VSRASCLLQKEEPAKAEEREVTTERGMPLSPCIHPLRIDPRRQISLIKKSLSCDPVNLDHGFDPPFRASLFYIVPHFSSFEKIFLDFFKTH